MLFLEDGFGDIHAARLREAGYTVEMFVDHFRNEQTQEKQKSVKDPSIMRLCNKECFLLVTTDHEMVSTHLEEIKKNSELAILATAHNNAPDFNMWIEALIKGQVEVRRYYKKQERPCFATFNTDGKITSKRTITSRHRTRRVRPHEQEPIPAKAS